MNSISPSQIKANECSSRFTTDYPARPDDSASVLQFVTWWLRYRPFLVPNQGSVRQIGDYRGITVYRDGPFQVQLFISAPHGIATEHTHPNVDSVEVHVAGDGQFTSDSNSHHFGMLRILPGENHGATTGPEGIAFFSIQKWLNGVPPSSVELDWGGEPLDAAHAKDIGA